MRTFEEELSGWGRFPVSHSRVVRPETPSRLNAIPSAFRDSAIIGRGRGLSYGDASLNADNLTVAFDLLNFVESFDRNTGVFTCQAGMTLEEIIRVVLPHGWFLPVTPGTRYPTIGGCFACDVHGKNHHQAGTLSKHVRWIELITAEGETLRCGPDDNADLFRATAGGLGLTGLISRVSLQLQRVGSAYIEEEIIRTPGLRETMEILKRYDADYPYSVAWLDCVFKPKEPGRGVVYFGRHAEAGTLEKDLWQRPFEVPGSFTAAIPFPLPVSLVRKGVVRVFNEARYRIGSIQNPSYHKGQYPNGTSRIRQHTPYDVFFYPLDRLKQWNRLYGPRGFVQYQFVVPFEAGETAVRTVLTRLLAGGFPPALAVLKRMGEAAGMLSFPVPGWTLAVDMGIRSGIFPLLDELDHIVADHGGRVYLVKDARLKAKMFRRMYPGFTDWLAVKQRVDPENRFVSDLSRRLRMNEERIP